MPRPPVFQLHNHSGRAARFSNMRAALHLPLRALVAGAMLPVALPGLPAQASQASAEAREPHPLEIFQNSEDRLFRVGYRLATANAAFCPHTVPVSGLMIHDAESYGDPEAVRKLFGLNGDIGIQAIAPGSPAAKAGLSQNDTLLALDGQTIAPHWQRTEPRWQRVFALRDAIDAALARGSLELNWQNSDGIERTAVIEGIPACPTRFELVDSKASAAADGERVLVGERFPGLAYDESAFAAAIAHEMAHNIMRHPQTFRKIGWKRKLVRLSERDADRLMPWLLHNAGYDPRAAVAFMREWGPKHGGWIFRKRTHDGWDERVEFIEAELPKLEASAAAHPEGLADWASGFTPELYVNDG